jgi:hypothetical protein
MSRSGSLLAALAASLLGVFALYGAGWFDPPAARAVDQVQAEAANSSRLPTIVHYRQGQLRHWRLCLLNQ